MSRGYSDISNGEEKTKARFGIHLSCRYAAENLKVPKQIGCTDLIGHGPPAPSIGIEDTGFGVWAVEDLVKMKRQAEDHDPRLETFEYCPPMDKIMMNLEGCQEQLENSGSQLSTSLRQAYTPIMRRVPNGSLGAQWIQHQKRFRVKIDTSLAR